MKRKKMPGWFFSRQMHFLYRLVVFTSWCLFNTLYRHRIYGLENYYEGGAILASNHVSYYDPPIIALSWPEEVHFLGRDTLFKNYFFGKFISALNTHPISGEVSDVKLFRKVCDFLEEGKQVVLFPEGGRSFDNQLQPLKPGIAFLVQRTKSAVIPMYIHGAHEVWPRKKKFPKLWGKTACIIGTPISYDQFAGLDRKEAQKAITQKLEQEIKALKKWYEEGAKGSPP